MTLNLDLDEQQAQRLREATSRLNVTVNEELYPTVTDKAAALCYSLVINHPFVDGNKRIGHAVMETFLMLNGRWCTA